MKSLLMQYKLSHLELFNEEDYFWLKENYASLSSKKRSKLFGSLVNSYELSNSKCSEYRQKYSCLKTAGEFPSIKVDIPKSLAIIGVEILPLIAICVLKQEILAQIGTVGFGIIKIAYPLFLIGSAVQLYLNRANDKGLKFNLYSHPIANYNYKNWNLNYQKAKTTLKMLKEKENSYNFQKTDEIIFQEQTK